LKDKVYPRLDKLHKHAGSNGFLAGELTVVDFYFYILVKIFSHLDKNVFTTYPKFGTLFTTIENFPGIKEYLAKESLTPKPFGPPQYLVWNATF